NWARLRAKPAGDRRVAIILANYPNKDGRIGNGVGLDTPESAARLLKALHDAGYRVEDPPADGAALMARLLAGPSNSRPEALDTESLSFATYSAVFATLPPTVQQQVAAQWGSAERDPFFRPGRLDCGRFAIPGFRCGNAAVLIQPARGYNLDPKATYHDPALVPPHSYLAAYAWLADEFRADAVIDLGKHGTLEWLPGKALALSAECLPEAVLGPLPHLYPFIVNDPGEGTQAKRRVQAVIVDHLTPPLTRAGTYGPLAELERLIDEYYEAARGDPRRIVPLAAEILERAGAAGIARDCGIAAADQTPDALKKLDDFLCELKDMQIRDGLHILGESPTGERLDTLLLALCRVRRGPSPEDQALPEDAAAPQPVLDWIERVLRPAVVACGPAETAAILAGLDGRRVAPGPSGAPSRGRPDVLPTGRNFFSVDTRAVPTAAAWQLGWHSAGLVVERYAQEHGRYPARIAMSAWGTANMRTGGDDIAQALALMGVRPVWESASGRVTGFEVLPASVLDRPRVDVTLRIS